MHSPPGPHLAGLSFVACVLAICPAASRADTGADLFSAWKNNPADHPQIPDVSYAGYGRAEVPLPNPAVVANVREAGAKGDGKADDTDAFKRAIATASRTGGAVLVPAGTYNLSSYLRLDSGVVLRGEGPDKTSLKFQKPLQDAVGVFNLGSSTMWSWAGGLIWIGPADTFGPDGKVAATKEYWERWQLGAELTEVVSEGARGTKTFQVQDGTKLSKGQTVYMVWENPPDLSLVKQVYGHPGTADSYDWKSATGVTPPDHTDLRWVVEIAGVQGNEVTLKQPVRLDVSGKWNVRFVALGNTVVNAGVEHLKLELTAPYEHTHLKNAGWNGIFFNRVVQGFARDIEIVNAENGVILAAAKNVTVSGVRLSGASQNHHSFACRMSSHDNLFEKFTVDGPHKVSHGINTEYFSSGNVWSKGVQKKGTFDSHRALSFDSVRTEMTTASDKDSGPGGADNAGPFVGRRVAHWNVQVTDAGGRAKSGEFIYQPRALSMGALVGIRGVALDTDEFYWMPNGDKGTVVADDGATPNPVNLYEAELRQRGFTPPDNSAAPPDVAPQDGGAGAPGDGGGAGAAGTKDAGGARLGDAGAAAGGATGADGGIATGGAGRGGSAGAAGRGAGGADTSSTGDAGESPAGGGLNGGCACTLGRPNAAEGGWQGATTILLAIGLSILRRRSRLRS